MYKLRTCVLYVYTVTRISSLSAWANGEPRKDPVVIVIVSFWENCMLLGGSGDHLWYDLDCGTGFPTIIFVVCEIEA